MIEAIKDILHTADIHYDYVEEWDRNTIRAGGWKYLHYDQLQTVAQYNFFKDVTVVNGELVLEFMKD